MLSTPNFDFSQSGNEGSLPFGAGSSIARARPRSHTPTALFFQSSSPVSTTPTPSNSTFQNSSQFGTVLY